MEEFKEPIPFCEYVARRAGDYPNRVYQVRIDAGSRGITSSRLYEGENYDNFSDQQLALYTNDCSSYYARNHDETWVATDAAHEECSSLAHTVGIAWRSISETRLKTSIHGSSFSVSCNVDTPKISALRNLKPTSGEQLSLWEE